MLDMTTIRQAGYVPVNGLQLYYQIHGGQPLFLLHGGLGTIDTFAEVMPSLAQNYRVVAVELQGHGHTADAERPFRFEQFADDAAALVCRLGLAPTDVLGFSLGGGVALQMAIRYPGVVRRLVVVSAPCRRSGWYPEVVEGMAMFSAESSAALVGSPMHDAYTRVAPEPSNWPKLVAKTGKLLGQDYDWSADVAAIHAPTLLVSGDRDSLKPAHVVEMFGLLGGGLANGTTTGPAPAQLAILPDTDHFDVLSSVLVSPVTAFLNEPVPGEKNGSTAPQIAPAQAPSS